MQQQLDDELILILAAEAREHAARENATLPNKYFIEALEKFMVAMPLYQEASVQHQQKQDCPYAKIAAQSPSFFNHRDKSKNLETDGKTVTFIGMTFNCVG